MEKLLGGTKFTSKVMGYQVHAIEKAIRPPFTDQVTFNANVCIF